MAAQGLRVFAAALLLLLGAAGPLDSYAQPGKLVALPDGRHINLRCTGTGSPTVILEAGFQAWSFAWDRIQPALSTLTRTCSYDRAGLGLSDPAPGPRDGLAQARDLAATLKAAKITPPYILVAHSAGAMTARLFADLQPKNVVGMVLLDPSVEGQFDNQRAQVAATVARYEACAAAAARHELPSKLPELSRCNRPAKATPTAFDKQVATLMLTPAYWQTLAREYAAIAGATTDQLRRGRQSYGKLPLVVLTPGGTGPLTEQAQAQLAAWMAAHDALAAKSSVGSNEMVLGSGHLLMRDQPDVIIEAVTNMVKAAR
jgi:pimeloyl-ACP methyl ester carboxylesterase